MCGWRPDGRFEDGTLAMCTTAWPYRELKREDFDAAVHMHSEGRRALLHRDGVGRRLMAPQAGASDRYHRRGAIPDVATIAW
jgi:hypothetical protein